MGVRHQAKKSSVSGKGAAIANSVAYVACWGLIVPVLIGAMLLSVAAHGFSWTSHLNWKSIKPYLAPLSPWVLTAGAVTQAFLASRRGLHSHVKPESRAVARLQERVLDTVDLVGWGLVFVGAFMAALATLS